MTRRRAAIAVILLVAGQLVWSVDTQPAIAAPSTAVSDSTAESTRTIPAYKDPDDPTRRIRVFTVSFEAVAGEKRYITSRINAYPPTTTPDELLMASITVICYPTGEPRASVGATQNTLRGTATVLTPRFVYTVPSTGTVNCHLYATGLRPRPVSTGDVTDNVWIVDSGSSLSASVPMPDWTETVVIDAASRVLDIGTQWTPINTWVSVAAGTPEFELVSDHKVTTCSSVGGSSDSTTNGADLCEGRVTRTGTTVNLTVKARQRDGSGSWCGDAQLVSSYDAFVSVDVHHKMLFSKGVVTVNPTCAPTFQVTGTVRVVDGADLMVHAPSEYTLLVER